MKITFLCLLSLLSLNSPTWSTDEPLGDEHPEKRNSAPTAVDHHDAKKQKMSVEGQFSEFEQESFKDQIARKINFPDNADIGLVWKTLPDALKDYMPLQMRILATLQDPTMKNNFSYLLASPIHDLIVEKVLKDLLLEDYTKVIQYLTPDKVNTLNRIPGLLEKIITKFGKQTPEKAEELTTICNPEIVRLTTPGSSAPEVLWKIDDIIETTLGLKDSRKRSFWLDEALLRILSPYFRGWGEYAELIDAAQFGLTTLYYQNKPFTNLTPEQATNLTDGLTHLTLMLQRLRGGDVEDAKRYMKKDEFYLMRTLIYHICNQPQRVEKVIALLDTYLPQKDPGSDSVAYANRMTFIKDHCFSNEQCTGQPLFTLLIESLCNAKEEEVEDLCKTFFEALDWCSNSCFSHELVLAPDINISGKKSNSLKRLPVVHLILKSVLQKPAKWKTIKEILDPKFSDRCKHEKPEFKDCQYCFYRYSDRGVFQELFTALFKEPDASVKSLHDLIVSVFNESFKNIHPDTTDEGASVWHDWYYKSSGDGVHLSYSKTRDRNHKVLRPFNYRLNHVVDYRIHEMAQAKTAEERKNLANNTLVWTQFDQYAKLTGCAWPSAVWYMSQLNGKYPHQASAPLVLTLGVTALTTKFGWFIDPYLPKIRF